MNALVCTTFARGNAFEQTVCLQSLAETLPMFPEEWEFMAFAEGVSDDIVNRITSLGRCSVLPVATTAGGALDLALSFAMGYLQKERKINDWVVVLVHPDVIFRGMWLSDVVRYAVRERAKPWYVFARMTGAGIEPLTDDIIGDITERGLSHQIEGYTHIRKTPLLREYVSVWNPKAYQEMPLHFRTGQTGPILVDVLPPELCRRTMEWEPIPELSQGSRVCPLAIYCDVASWLTSSILESHYAIVEAQSSMICDVQLDSSSPDFLAGCFHFRIGYSGMGNGVMKYRHMPDRGLPKWIIDRHVAITHYARAHAIPGLRTWEQELEANCPGYLEEVYQ